MSPAAPSALDRLLGRLAFGIWQLVGLMAWPVFWLHPRLRRFVWRVPHPVPGWTWIHGASLGEHRVVAALQASLPRVWPTSASPRTTVVGAFSAPADLPWSIGPWLDRARPGRLVLVEGELWPGWLVACRRRGIPVVVVQARRSRGWQRWERLGPVWRWMMDGVVVLPQVDTGDLKAAAPVPDVEDALEDGSFVAASTRPGDERRLLDARDWRSGPLLVLGVRHRERVDDVVDEVRRRGLRVGLRSRREQDVDVLVVDTHGELAGLMKGARAAFVGGTFDPALGGHSPAEAFAQGLPVVHGPHTQANPAAWSGGRGLESTGQADDLRDCIERALALGPRLPQASSAVAKVLDRLPAPVTPPEPSLRSWLWPLVPFVHGIGRLRPAWWGRPRRVSVPVVSVGGLTAGGTGKSPLAGLIAKRLDGAWVVARGYRRGPGPAVRVGWPDRPPRHFLGDELEMLRRQGLRVVSAPDRVAGAAVAIENGAQVIVLDDGFQHRRLARDLDIVCVDARWPTGGGPIPVGSGREDTAALGRAHAVVEVHPAPDSTAPLRLRYVPRGWRIGGAVRPLDAVVGDIDVVVGIARPESFICQLLELGLRVRSVAYVADHGGLSELPPGCVVTEKDAARLPADADIRVLLVDTVVEGELDVLLARLTK